MKQPQVVPIRPPSVKQPQGAQIIPINQNESVKDVLMMLKVNHADLSKQVQTMVGQVGELEKQLASATAELASLKSQLPKANEGSKSPLSDALKQTVQNAQSQVSSLGECLSKLKNMLIEICRAMMDTFKKSGVVALNQVAQLSKAKPILETVANQADQNIKVTQKEIAKIETLSTHLRESIKHVKNVGRVMAGHEQLTEAKPMGIAAKVCLNSLNTHQLRQSHIKQTVNKLMGRLESLEKRAEQKPSLQTALKQATEKAQAQPPKAKPALKPEPNR